MALVEKDRAFEQFGRFGQSLVVSKGDVNTTQKVWENLSQRGETSGVESVVDDSNSRKSRECRQTRGSISRNRTGLARKG